MRCRASRRRPPSSASFLRPTPKRYSPTHASACSRGRAVTGAPAAVRRRCVRGRRLSRRRCMSSRRAPCRLRRTSPSRRSLSSRSSGPYHRRLRAGSIVRAAGGTGIRASSEQREPDRHHDAEPQYAAGVRARAAVRGTLRASRTAADAGLGTVPAASSGAGRARQLDATTVATPARLAFRSTTSAASRARRCRRYRPPPLPRAASGGHRRSGAVARGRSPADGRRLRLRRTRRRTRRAIASQLSRRAAPQAAARPGARPVSPRTEIGQLVENIPRSMRVAVPAARRGAHRARRRAGAGRRTCREAVPLISTRSR